MNQVGQEIPSKMIPALKDPTLTLVLPLTGVVMQDMIVGGCEAWAVKITNAK